jgi:hypothetical protein
MLRKKNSRSLSMSDNDTSEDEYYNYKQFLCHFKVIRREIMFEKVAFKKKLIKKSNDPATSKL